MLVGWFTASGLCARFGCCAWVCCVPRHQHLDWYCAAGHPPDGEDVHDWSTPGPPPLGSRCHHGGPVSGRNFCVWRVHGAVACTLHQEERYGICIFLASVLIYQLVVTGLALVCFAQLGRAPPCPPPAPPCPALPRPALPCPALPCPAPPRPCSFPALLIYLHPLAWLWPFPLLELHSALCQSAPLICSTLLPFCYAISWLLPATTCLAQLSANLTATT